MYPTLFIDPNLIEVIKSGDIWLSTTPDVPGSISFESAFPRLATWLIGRIKPSDQIILIANCHLDHIKSETRLQQAKVLCEQLKKINQRNLPLILMGDFNESPSRKVRNHINNSLTSLVDPWGNYHNNEEASHHDFGKNNKTFERIDWILVDRRIEILSYTHYKEGHIGQYPSDHFPVMMEISG